MNRIIITINSYLKGLIFLIRPHIFIGWLKQPLLMSSNILTLTKWISQQNKKNILDDFYSIKRDYSKRYHLYQYVVDTLSLKNEAVDYLEFGVSGGYSFKWWVSSCDNADCRFYGFDTFEGLPEDWGTYRKGDMAAELPAINDSRVEFIKGLFQNTIPNFLLNCDLRNGKRKIVHLDADLFSSTLFTLTSLASYLKKGDILLFDEFNVPNHEFFAFNMFCKSYYVKTRLIGSVNNYFQVALIIE
jgi:O-methyltransferase